MLDRVRTQIKARKKTVINWINEKFGSLEMLAGLAGVDTTHRSVRAVLEQVRTSREPVILSIRWRDVVIEVHIEHHLAASKIKTRVSGDPTEAFESADNEGSE